MDACVMRTRRCGVGEYASGCSGRACMRAEDMLVGQGNLFGTPPKTPVLSLCHRSTHVKSLQGPANDQQQRNRAPLSLWLQKPAHLSDQLGTNVLHWVLQLDLTCNGHTVVHNLGGAVLGLQHHVAALQRRSFKIGKKGDVLDNCAWTAAPRCGPAPREFQSQRKPGKILEKLYLDASSIAALWKGCRVELHIELLVAVHTNAIFNEETTAWKDGAAQGSCNNHGPMNAQKHHESAYQAPL
eukprot:1161900-Pelagomonas_calceolata.AAC.7